MRSAPFRTIIIFFTLSVIGFALLPRLSVQWLPGSRQAQLSVSFSWPDASPSAVEQEVITSLEGAFQLVQGVESIYSVAQNGGGSLRLSLAEGADPAYLRFEVASRIRQLYPQLPVGVSFPQITPYDPGREETQRPLLAYSLSGVAGPGELSRYAREQLSPRLALTQGLRSISIQGGARPEWRIRYERDKLNRLGLSATDVLAALQQHFQQASLGRAEEMSRQYSIRLNNEVSAPAEEILPGIPIQKRAGRLIRLGDVAAVEYGGQPPRQYYRINGQTSIRLLFYPEEGANTIRLAEKIRAEVAALEPALPSSYRLHLEDDATEYLSAELNKIARRTALSLGILLLFVLLAYRSRRYLAIVLLSLAANLGLAFILYHLFQMELHLYAVAGITVSFGIIIDNSIVMMHHLRGQGNLNVFPALLASTLTTISALAVIWFLPEHWQHNLLDFAKVIGINLGASLLVALFLIPALMERIGLRRKEESSRYGHRRRVAYASRLYRRLLAALLRRRPWVMVGMALLFGLPVFLLPDKIPGQEWYNRSLGNDWYVENVKPHVNKALGGTLRLFAWYVYESAAPRHAGETVLYIRGAMPPGATPEQMNRVFEQMEAYVGQFDREVKLYATQVYGGQHGSMQIYFNPGYDHAFAHRLKSRLVAYSLNLGGVQWDIFGIGQGFSNAAGGTPPQFRVALYGYNKEELARQAGSFAEKLLAHPRVTEVDTEANIDWRDKELYEYVLELKRRRTAERGAAPYQVSTVLHHFNQSTAPAWMLPDGAPLRLIDKNLNSNDLWALLNETQQADSIKLSFASLAKLEKRQVSSSIHKENQQYIRMVEFQYNGSYRFGNRFLEEVMAAMQKEMPLGYSMSRKTWDMGAQESRQYALFLLVVTLIFMICAVVFESLKQALAIVLLIPLSFIGIFLAFYWFGFPFDQGGYTSFVLLSGIVVNSLILIVNDFNYFRKKQPQRSSPELYLKAFHHKITPILLTILSTSLGLIPFLIHGPQEVFWFSLAVGAIGGLLFSVFLIVLVMPVFFISTRRAG